jgi:site-specific DNA recombinase
VTARVSWFDRPRASALRATLDDPDRGFDAVAQFRKMALLFEGRGVQVWMPEAGGLVPVDSPGFPALLTELQSVVHSSAVRGVGPGRRRPGGQGSGQVRP